MNDPLRTDPIFSAEAQEAFTVGCRVYDSTRPAHEKHLAAEGVYLGYVYISGGGRIAYIEWDDSHAVTPEDFSEIRNLYR